VIAHYYEKLLGIYVLRVNPDREYRIEKISSHKWEWSEWVSFCGLPSKKNSGIRKRFKDCLLAVEMDNQFKPKTNGYPPLNPFSNWNKNT
jgi:hypothetical protein